MNASPRKGGHTLGNNSLHNIIGSQYELVIYFLGVAAEAMSHVALKGMPIGIVHALWAGLAIITVTLLSAVIYRQHLDLTTWFGMGLVAIGIAMINVSQGHSH